MDNARSLLFVPATGERKIERAFGSNADGVIVDLEDAVAADRKEAARRALASILAPDRGRAAYVRVNAVDSPHCYDDLAAIPLRAVAGIVLPKAESASDIRTVDWVLTALERRHGLPPRSVALLAIIETAKGMTALDEVASASPRLRRLAFGAVDLGTDMAASFDDDTVAAQARFAIARASRAARLERPIDTPLLALDDPERLRAAAARARASGFSGKLCIHPAQIDIVNEAFSPSAAELERAARVVAAFEAAEAQGRAALSVDGEMVDYPVVERARRLLALGRGTR